MTDIEALSSAYRERLDEAERVGAIPENLSLEVSSPGVERVVRIPEELERFRDKPMHVRYTISGDAAAASPQETEGIFRLVSFDLECCHCTVYSRCEDKQKADGKRKTARQETEGVAVTDAI